MSSLLERVSGAATNLDTADVRSAVINNFHGGPTDFDDGNGSINPLDTVHLDDHIVVPRSLPNTITRHMVFRIYGSMQQLARETHGLVCKAATSDIYRSHTRYSPNANTRMDDPHGDLDQVALLGAKVVSFHSTFPVSLNVEFVDGDDHGEIRAFRGNFRDVATGQRMHYTIPPLGQCGNSNKPINTTSPFIHSSYLDRYKGLVSGEALRSTGITQFQNGISMVSADHPVVRVIVSNQNIFKLSKNQFIRGDSPPNPETGDKEEVYFIDSTVVNDCIAVLVADLKYNLPLINLANMQMKFSRPGTMDNKFDQPAGMVFEPDIAGLSEIKNTDGSPKYTQRNVQRYADVVVAISYAYL